MHVESWVWYALSGLLAVGGLAGIVGFVAWAKNRSGW